MCASESHFSYPQRCCILIVPTLLQLHTLVKLESLKNSHSRYVKKEHSALTRVLVDVLYAAIFYTQNITWAHRCCPRTRRIKSNAYICIYRLIDLDLIYVLEFFRASLFLMKASKFRHSPQGVILASIYYDYLPLMMLQLLVFLLNE